MTTPDTGRDMPYDGSKTIGLCRIGRNYTHGTTQAATDSEARLGLALKMHEEVAELTRAPHDIGEYADVLQALRDYAAMHRIVWEDVEAAAVEKRKECGGFLPALLWKARSV